LSRLEFIEKIVGHIAWPAAAIVVLLRHLTGIFAALKSLKLPGGVELELYDRFNDLREQAEAAKLPVPESPTQIDDEHGKFLRMAEDFPVGAIMETWIWLEKEVVDLDAAYAPQGVAPSNRPRLLPQALRDLRQGEVIDPATFQVIDRLRGIRNDVVHARREAVTPGEALEFRELATAVIERLRQIRS
jgi:hypothetical protein